MNRNPVWNLGIKENRHEQSVNFCKNQVQIIKILGCIVEGVFVVPVTALLHIITNKICSSLSTAEIISFMHKYPVAYFPKFLAQILNDTAHILVLIYEKIFSSDCRPSCAITAPRFITIISSAELRASRRSVSDMTADQCSGIIEIKSLSLQFSP